jgi:hypothetical protein
VSKPYSPLGLKTVRLSVPIPVSDHARLCGLAALRQVDRASLAARFIHIGLRGVIVRGPDSKDAETDETVESEPTLAAGQNGRLPRV